jgi:hypothetical protein
MLEQEAINRMRKRNDLIEVKEYNKGLDQELSHRMKQERQQSIKNDPKPIKPKPKKYTHGKGWHRDEDGRASASDL